MFLTPYPIGEAPSQRFRFEQYLGTLKKHGHTFTFAPFLPSKKWNLFYSSGYLLEKVSLLLTGFLKRFVTLLKSHKYDYVFIHREAAPIGPPVFEFILAKILSKRIIYDFDDAIWMTDKRIEGRLEKMIRWRNKVRAICRWSYRVSCGNDYLCNYARQFNKQVILNPTTIDTEQLHNPNLFPRQADRSDLPQIIIGWTGSHSTLKYLDLIKPILHELVLENQHLHFLIIANHKPNLGLERMHYVPWNKETEIQDLMLADIGIMPLPDDAWAKGKCGFKALQYMALQIPTIASPVGVNSEIIDHGVDGFLASSLQEWKQYLGILISSVELRRKMGESSRKKIVENYSVLSNSTIFLSLFQ